MMGTKEMAALWLALSEKACQLGILVLGFFESDEENASTT